MKYHSKWDINHGNFAEVGRFSFLARRKIIKNSVYDVMDVQLTWKSIGSESNFTIS